MIEDRYPGLYRNRVPSGFWPLLAASAVLHVGLFWGFARVPISRPHRMVGTPIEMVELAPPGGGGNRGVPTPTPAPAPRRETAAPPPEGPKPSAPVPAEPQPPPPIEPQARKPAAVLPRPPQVPRASPVPPPTTTRPVSRFPAATVPKKEPPKPKSEEGTDERVSEAIARLRAKAGGQDRVADRVSRLRDRNEEPDAAVAQKIARLRERQIQGSEAQVSQRIAALRQQLGTRAPARDAGGGPVGVSGGEGGGGLQGFLQARYIDGLREHLNLYWSVPDTLRGRDLEAYVTVIVDRRGKIVNWSVKEAGNRLFDDLVKRAVAQADPFPVVPNGMPGERFEFELRFSAP